MQPPVTLITGGARRIGAAITRILHENGHHVVIHYRTSEKEAHALAHELNEIRPNSAAALSADLNRAEETTALAHRAASIWGRLSACIHNASSFIKTPMGNSSEKTWDGLFNIHLKAPFFLAEAARPYLEIEKGTIVLIGDASHYHSGYPIYSISKNAVPLVSKVLAREMAPHIRVNTISPGQILWPEGDNAFSLEMKQKTIERSALKREGHVLDIAKTVLFLIRDAHFITGQNLSVDGGRLVMI